MKNKKFDKSAQHIREAIAALGEGFATLDVRNHLIQAASLLEKVDKKKNMINNYVKSYQEKAIEKNKQWWESLNQGVIENNKPTDKHLE